MFRDISKLLNEMLYGRGSGFDPDAMDPQVIHGDGTSLVTATIAVNAPLGWYEDGDGTLDALQNEAQYFFKQLGLSRDGRWEDSDAWQFEMEVDHETTEECYSEDNCKPDTRENKEAAQDAFQKVMVELVGWNGIGGKLHRLVMASKVPGIQEFFYGPERRKGVGFDIEEVKLEESRQFDEALPKMGMTKKATPDDAQRMFGPVSKAMAKAIADKHNKGLERQQKFGGQCDTSCATKHKTSEKGNWLGDTPQEKYKHCMASRQQCCDDDTDEAKDACGYILKK